MASSDLRSHTSVEQIEWPVPSNHKQLVPEGGPTGLAAQGDGEVLVDKDPVFASLFPDAGVADR